MGSMEIPSQGAEVIKVPTSTYDFGANFLDPKVVFFQEGIGPVLVLLYVICMLILYFDLNVIPPKMMLIGRVSHDGRVNARVKCDLTDNLCLKINAQVIDLASRVKCVFM